MLRSGHDASPPPAVVLWGLGDYADRYLACLEEAHVEVALCVDGSRAGSAVGGVAVVSPRECARQAYRYAHLPVVVAATGVGGVDGFNDAARSIACEFDLPAKLLHPVFLARHLDLNYDGGVVLGGFPGAGQSLVRPILRRLLERRPWELGSREKLFARLASAYHFHTLKPALDVLFDLGGRFASRAFTVAGDHVAVDMRLSHGRRAMIYNLRSPTFLHQRLHSTHERLTEATVRRFRQMNRTVVAIVRHPADLLVAAGTRLVAGAAPLLANLEWFRNMAVLVKGYYECVLDRGARIGTIRYEDLLGAPARTICRLGGVVGMEVGAEEATAIWDAVSLPTPPGRRANEPGAGLASEGPGAWRRVLEERHVGILRDLDYGPLLDALGYDPAFGSVRAGPSRLATAGHALDSAAQRNAAYQDFEYHVLYGKPIDLRHEGLHCWSDPTLGLSLLASDPDLCQLANIGLGSRYFRVRLLAAST